MLTKATRYFNTSGPNHPNEHYTLKRESLIKKGLDSISKDRYFTIWAPRQSGKSTYIKLLSEELIKSHYKVTYIDFENFKNESLSVVMTLLKQRIKEAALCYSFETYIQTLVETLEGKSYLEAHTGLGRCDMIISIRNSNYVVEFKIFRDLIRFEKGKAQLAYYCNSENILQGIHLVFVPNSVDLPEIRGNIEIINNIEIKTYIIFYDEEKDF
jgi:hypothetical protein